MSIGHTQSAQSVLAHLELPATPALPRKLSLLLGLLSGHLTALVVVDYHVTMAADGYGEVAESAAMGSVLRIGNTRFKLLPEEVEPIRTFLARFPCAEPTIRSDSAKQAAPVVLPPDGSCRESPPPDARSSGGGALGRSDHA